jgi:uncharacterized protein YbjT (DUF2867 family)
MSPESARVDQDKGTVLVVGASGSCGTEIVRLLRNDGWPVRAMTRTPELTGDLVAMGAEVVKGDLIDRASLEAACQGVVYVVASAHAALSKGKNSPQTVDRQGHRDLVDIARNVGVKHFVYVGAIGGQRYEAVDFFRIKRETEEYVMASGLDYTIVRGAAFMETTHEFIGSRIAQSGKAVVFGAGKRLNSYVSVKDMARFVVLALTDPRLKNRGIDVSAPEPLTSMQVIDIYENVTGRIARRTHVPVPLLRVASGVATLVHPVARRMLQMVTIAATSDITHDTTALQSEFPGHLTTFEESAREWAAILQQRSE